jgi:hypothetical protein
MPPGKSQSQQSFGTPKRPPSHPRSRAAHAPAPRQHPTASPPRGRGTLDSASPAMQALRSGAPGPRVGGHAPRGREARLSVEAKTTRGGTQSTRRTVSGTRTASGKAATTSGRVRTVRGAPDVPLPRSPPATTRGRGGGAAASAERPQRRGSRFYFNLTGFPFPIGPFFERKTVRKEVWRRVRRGGGRCRGADTMAAPHCWRGRHAQPPPPLPPPTPPRPGGQGPGVDV